MIKQQISHKLICLADDDDDDRQLFLDAVSELGMPFEVEEATDAQQLMRFLHNAGDRLPEIIFLDINMPGKSGLECLRELRSPDGKFTGIAVVMLSTSSSPDNIDLSYELGADFYIVKPDSFQSLKGLLLDLLLRLDQIKKNH